MIKEKRSERPIEAVKDLAEKVAKSLGFDLWGVKLLKEGSGWYLRIFIDKEGGIGIEDCEKMSRAIDKPLDELDPIENSYCLEVCSPGIERELSTDAHLQKYLNCSVTVTLIRKDAQGNKKITAKLNDFGKTSVLVENSEGQVLTLPRSNIAHIRLSADFL